MSEKPSLYFIGLIPHPKLAKKATVIKNDFALNYRSNKALKVMPHITLQHPFKRMASFETEFHLRLQDFFSAFQSFDIRLSDFGCFDNNTNKVIFIDVVKNELLFELHRKLIYFLREEIHFSAKESPYSFHPHMTVAYRDLTPEQFSRAWQIYKMKTFEDSFVADCAYLLKHDFRKWEVLSKFDFKK